MDKKKLTTFSLSLYGDITAYNQTMSLVRCRIFYKYGNRNGTYITDDFAEKLISTLTYTPIKGIYDSLDQDFTDHGSKRSLGRIYGIVPVENHFAWEKHLDNDGIEREYACTDVLLYTAIYQKEALDIINSAQSMELYVDSIDGKWEFINGKKYFVFTEGCFLGLQALGKEFEPCFEGAGFYSLATAEQIAEKITEKLQQYELDSNISIGGKEQMNFKLSDNQKYNMIWSILNSRFNEENGYIMDYAVCDVYDEYAIVFKFEDGSYERAYYTKNDAEDSLAIDRLETCYIIDVNEDEKKALDMLHQLNGNTYEKVDEVYSEQTTTITTLTEEKTKLEETNSDFSKKIEEHEATIATLEQEKTKVEDSLTQVTSDYQVAQENIKTLTEEKEALETYKKNIIRQEKEAIVERYADLLDAEAIESFKVKLEDMTKENLEKELAFTYVQSKESTLFTKHDDKPGYVPNDTGVKTGIEGILERYKNK